MRILHLAYEDPMQPGAGGGSIRTREINRRLAARHEITALVAGYRGARSRVEDGVHWVPVGFNAGGSLSRLAYFGLVAPHVLSRPHDLVVEEFGAPFSVGLGPLLTRRPLIASVQWFFAAEMRAKYGLPFDLVERRGVGMYKRVISVSDWLARDIGRRAPTAAIRVIPNGIDVEAFEVPFHPAEHLLFVGRLDMHHKGGDLLIDIAARLHRTLGADAPELLVVGDGPDREALALRAQQSGLGASIRFCGRVEGRAKYELMAKAHALLVPSRFETFGMVVTEALACGVPVVAFDVGPLAEVAGGRAHLVPPFDAVAFAEQVARIVRDPRLREEGASANRDWARRYDWDDIADQQEAYYLEVVGDRRTELA